VVWAWSPLASAPIHEYLDGEDYGSTGKSRQRIFQLLAAGGVDMRVPSPFDLPEYGWQLYLADLILQLPVQRVLTAVCAVLGPGKFAPNYVAFDVGVPAVAELLTNIISYQSESKLVHSSCAGSTGPASPNQQL